MSLRRPNFSDGEGEESINISPLIDVIFILLIFFVVTTTFSDGGAVKIDVPKAATAVRPEAADNLDCGRFVGFGRRREGVADGA